MSTSFVVKGIPTRLTLCTFLTQENIAKRQDDEPMAAGTAGAAASRAKPTLVCMNVSSLLCCTAGRLVRVVFSC